MHVFQSYTRNLNYIYLYIYIRHLLGWYLCASEVVRQLCRSSSSLYLNFAYEHNDKQTKKAYNFQALLQIGSEIDLPSCTLLLESSD